MTMAVSDDDTTVYQPTEIGFSGSGIVFQDGTKASIILPSGGGTECSTSSCDLNSATTLDSKDICLDDGTNCPAAGAGDLKADGTTPLTANWDVGAFDITMQSLILDGAGGGEIVLNEGTAPTTGAGQGGIFVKDISGQPELVYVEESDGDEVQLTNGGAVAGGSAAIPFGHRNLVVKSGTTNETQVDIDAEYVVTKTAGDAVLVASSVNETCTITTSGINGLEASDSESSNTWYELYIMEKADETVDCLMNEAGTSIDTIPTDYTYSAFVGYARNDSSSDLYDFQQRGFTWMNTEVSPGVLSNGSATSPTDVDCSAAVAPKGNRAFGVISCQDSDSGNVCRLSGNGAASQIGFANVDGSGDRVRTYYEMDVDINQIFDYLVDNSSGADMDIEVSGFFINF